MQTLAVLLNKIAAIDPAAMSRAQRHIDGLLKPVGSLGRLEALAVQRTGGNAARINRITAIAAGQKDGTVAVACQVNDGLLRRKRSTISPKEVTAIQPENMTRGTTGVCVLAAQAGANVSVSDPGVYDSAEPIARAYQHACRTR